ncbi:MAG: Ferredoxin-2 [Syntrophorhabdus sp. PtaU1.Bin050]|nr:MAG: Ferredoxin-2 [Syntrophorhabdus sp. PtaU1.Bin050]
MANPLRYLKGVVTLSIDNARCTGCGQCKEVCPHDVLSVRNGKVDITDRDACMECGACSRNCPFEAITVSAGVGCANAVIRGFLRGSPPDCSCSSEDPGCCC